jgi:carboxyl-terminal processing protease
MATRLVRRPAMIGLVCLCGLVPLTAAPAGSADGAHFTGFVGDLGGRAEERGRARAALAAIGEPMLPALRAAAATADSVAVRDEAGRLVTEIEGRRPGVAAFVAKVEKLAEVLDKDSVLEPTPADVTEAAVRALYDVKGPFPPDMVARLTLVRAMDARQRHALLWDAAAALDEESPFDPEKTPDEILPFFLRRLDPNADWIDPSRLTPFCLGCGDRGRIGVGLQLSRDPKSRLPRVVVPLRDGPAYAAGVHSGDLLTHVTRFDAAGVPEEHGTEGLALAAVEKLLLGSPEERVRLTVRRRGADGPLEFLMGHGAGTPETVVGVRRRSDDEWDYWIDDARRVGYVRILRFDEETFETLRAVLDRLQGEGMRGLVLDLRFNPGYLLNSAVDVADLFIDDGVIVTIRQRSGRETTFAGRHDGSLLDFPMACLVNGETGGGAEIVAACLQDHGRAAVVGERTCGRGGVQNVHTLGEGKLRLTTAYLVRPNGKSLARLRLPGRDEDEWGVTPDPGFTVDLKPDDRCRLRDHLDAALSLPSRRGPPDAFWDRQLDASLTVLRR